MLIVSAKKIEKGGEILNTYNHVSSCQRIAAFFPELFILMSPCPSPSARKSNLQFTQKMQDYQLLAIFGRQKMETGKLPQFA